MSKGLIYWVPYLNRDGVKMAACGGHPSCFGYLPTVSERVPQGATPLNHLYLSTDFTKEQWELIYSALRRDVKQIKIHDKVYDAPVCEYIEDTVPRGYVITGAEHESYGKNLAVMKVTFPVELNQYEVYAYIKYYCKLLSLPFSKRVGQGQQKNPFDALSIIGKVIKEKTGKVNFCASYFALAMTNHMIGYSFPAPMGWIYCDALKKHLGGHVEGRYSVWDTRGESPAQWAGVAKGAYKRICVGDSYGLQVMEAQRGQANAMDTTRFYPGSPLAREKKWQGNETELVEYYANVVADFMVEHKL